MSKENSYSKEWIALVESAIIYQKNLGAFFEIREDLKLRDLKNVLRQRNLVYYGLKVVENVSNDIIHKLLNELIYIVIYGNISNSHIAKKIVLESNTQLFRKEICRMLIKYSVAEKENINTLKDIAIFLYELQYKKELLQFVDENISALKESEFIESEEDLKELYDMEDLSNE